MRSRSYAQAERQGRRAETLSAWLLRLKGYRILCRDYKSKVGEIDLIARRGRTVAFVEVKARDDFTVAAEAVTSVQRKRIERAAMQFLARRPELAGFDIRFDVVLVIPRRLPRHLAASWRAEA